MADEIVAVYRAEVDQYKKAVDDLTNRINALDKAQNKVGDDAQADFGKGAKAVGGMTSQVSNLTASLKQVAVGMGVAFSVQQLLQFGKEAVTVAARAEGIERAFKRIGNPQLLDGLRKATRGTVTDINLMTTAIQASNFKIPLEELATYLQFATQRANETGKSVDYMVESILTGVGRGSIEVWDNLGFSLGEVRQHLNGVAVESLSVGERAKLMSKLVNAELVKMGEQADTTADALGQLSTKWDNIKKSIGAAVIEAAKFFEIIDDSKTEAGLLRTEERAKQVSYALGVVTNEMRGINDETEKQQALEEKLAQKRTESQRLLKTIQDIEAQRVAITAKVAAAETVYQNASNSNLKFRSAAEKERIEQAGVIIKDGEKELSILKEQRKEAIEKLSWTSAYTTAIDELIGKKETSNDIDAKEIRNVYFLTNAIKDLKDEREQEGVTLARTAEIKRLLPPLEEELKRLLEDEKVKVKELTRSLNDLAAAFEETMKMRMDAINAFYDEQQIGATREIADAQERARVLEEIERNRLREQITLLQGFGLAATSERLKLAQSEAKILDDSEALYQRFLAGQEADYMAYLERKKQADILAQEESKKIALAAMNATIQIIGIVSQAQQQATQYELEQLQNALDAGQITREEYDIKRRRLLREQAKQDKELALIQAIIATAAAIAEALPNVPLSIIAGVLGAAQVAAIAAQPLPQFAKGVIDLQGKGTGTSDSILARLSKGESVMTNEETKQHKPLFTAIRKGMLDEYINKNYVRPAIDSAMLAGLNDIGRSADLNGLTAKLSDHNIIAAMDRNRSATVYGLKMLADKLDKRTQKRGGYA
jgi:hypothetical protein